jgi:hypothetical protein
MTIDLENEKDLEWLQRQRKKVSCYNAARKELLGPDSNLVVPKSNFPDCRQYRVDTRPLKWRERVRVDVKGRLGKNNPNAKNYRSAITGKSYMGSHRTIRIEDARYADVYVREVRDYA